MKEQTEQKQDKFEFIIIPKNVLQDQRLSKGSLMLYGYLLFRTGENDYCWPGYNTIQKDLKLTRPTITRSIKQLEKLGWLTYTPGSKGKRGSNRYYLKSTPQLNQIDKVGNSYEVKLIRTPYTVGVAKVEKDSNDLHSEIVMPDTNNSYAVHSTLVSGHNPKRIDKRIGKENLKEEENPTSSLSSSQTQSGETPETPFEEVEKEISLEDISIGKFQGRGKHKSRDDSKDPLSIPQGVPHTCPLCNSPTVQRTSGKGPFTGCSSYPKCKWVFRRQPAPRHIQAIKDEDWYQDWKDQIPED